MKKHYGNERTNLRLTDKAQFVYSNSDPIDIYEEEIDDEVFRYSIKGIIERDDMTEDELNDLLEDLFLFQE